MGNPIDLKNKFLEYLHDQEGFGLRSERLDSDITNIRTNPLITSSNLMAIVVKWMEAAYRQGARDMAQDTLDTLGDYATAVAGINERVYNRSQAYDAAKDNLMVYYTQVLDEE